MKRKVILLSAAAILSTSAAFASHQKDLQNLKTEKQLVSVRPPSQKHKDNHQPNKSTKDDVQHVHKLKSLKRNK